jgi:hypothetical protein
MYYLSVSMQQRLIRLSSKKVTAALTLVRVVETTVMILVIYEGKVF